MARRKCTPFIAITAKDWTEIYYAVELKRLQIAEHAARTHNVTMAWISSHGAARWNASKMRLARTDGEYTKP